MFEQSFYGQPPQSLLGNPVGQFGHSQGGFGSYGTYPQTGSGLGSTGNVGGINPLSNPLGSQIDPLTAAYLQQLITSQHLLGGTGSPLGHMFSPTQGQQQYGQSLFGQGSQIGSQGGSPLGQNPWGAQYGAGQYGQGSPFGQFSPLHSGFGQNPYQQVSPLAQIHPQQALAYLQAVLASQYLNPINVIGQQLGRVPFGVSPLHTQHLLSQQQNPWQSNWPGNPWNVSFQGQGGGFGQQFPTPFQSGGFGYGTGMY